MTTISSPHAHQPASVTRVMLRVVYALVPAIIAHTWLFGWGMMVNIAIASAAALGAEAAMLALRGRAINVTLADGSALVTAVLLGFALPPLAPWWLVALGAAFAIVFAKQIYGGLGYNPFNPAMVGYVLLLISFPREMTTWLSPSMLGGETLSLAETLRYAFTGALPAGLSLDTLSGATPLDFMKTELSLNKTVSETLAAPLFGAFGGQGFEVVNGLVLLGGLWLVWNRTITWHTPVGLLGALFLMAGLFWSLDPDTHAGPLFHLMSGGAMLGAFFIATDPTTCATSNRGRLIFGAGAGVLIYVIRTWGGYPDGIAFSVLLMNLAAPTIDYYTRPRVYGHTKG
ncbi:MAG: electron transport complex subunit RsxD [Thiohalomonadaceae bacterium]